MFVLKIGREYFALPIDHAQAIMTALPHLKPVERRYERERGDFYQLTGRPAEIVIDIGSPIEPASDKE